MDIELIEIRNFLASHSPFDLLPESELDKLPRALEVVYARRDSAIFAPGDDCAFLFIIRSGAIEITDADGQLLSRRGEGDAFGARSILRGKVVHNVRAIEDALLYKIPREQFHRLCEKHERFAYFFHADVAKRLHDAVSPTSTDKTSNNFNLATLPIKDLLADNFEMLPADTPIKLAAQQMTDRNISSILIGNENKLEGIVTERDLCVRCIAAELDVNQPVSQVMTADPFVISQNAYAFSALSLMSRRNIRHLPVTHNERITGVITATDLIQRQSASSVYLVAEIYRKSTIEQLADVSRLIPMVVVNLVETDATAHSIGHMVSAIGEAITVRLLQLAEENLGPAPVPYCWMNFGSLARMEQAALSDQDNGLLLDNSFDREQHDTYFIELARFVNDGLDACGYEYCPGGIMASNIKWRQTLSTWQGYFDTWTKKPEPKALMHASIFFDMRFMHGEKKLFGQLKTHVMQRSKGNSIFLAHLTGNALHLEPPLGFFRRFVLVNDGKHDNTLDMKHNGVVPIVDLARIFALSGGVRSVNTQSRLEAVAGAGNLSSQGAADLRDALEFIGMTRLRHQARLIKKGNKADNFVAPDELSNFERNHLKDAFEIVRTIQSALGQRYQAGRF